MGDNRPSSQDSRVFGPVDEDTILGRAWLRYFPLERIGLIERPDYPALDTGRRPGAVIAGQARAGSSATIHASTRPVVVDQRVRPEPEGQLRLRRLRRVRRVDQVPQSADAEVAADRPRLGLVRHRLADHPANDGDGVRALERDGGHRPGGDELDQPVVEVLPGVDGVVLLRHRARHRQQAQPDDLEALALEARRRSRR